MRLNHNFIKVYFYKFYKNLSKFKTDTIIKINNIFNNYIKKKKFYLFF